MISDENIKLHTLSDRFILSNISFGIQSISPDVYKKKPIHQSNPHKHDSYFIKYIIEGSGSHNIDFINYEVLPHSIFFMAPGQVHSYDMLNVKGFVIYFKTDLIAINELPFFNQSYTVPVLYLKSEDEIIDRIFQSLLSEYQNNKFQKNELIRANLQSLLILMTRKYFQQKDMTGSSLPKHVEIINKLSELIDIHFIEHRSTSFYSNALNISTRQLNNILNKNMSKSISVLIRERILVEAKRLLCYTDKTISEIAYQLNFSDKTYFHKFFKVNEKITPEVFRKNISTKVNIS